MYYRIAVNFPKKDSVLTYKVSEPVEIGDIVEVPLGKRSAKGVVWEKTKDASFDGEIKEVKSILSKELSLDTNERELYLWMSKYYHYSLGKLILYSLPKIMKRPRPFEVLKGLGHKDQFSMKLSKKK